MPIRVAFFLAFSAAVASMVSIAACQTLMAAALLALLMAREKLRAPRVVIAIAFFVAWTLLALLLSPDPRAGLPQVKKFYVFLMLPIVYTAFTAIVDIRRLIWWWTAAATASGLWGFVQFWMKRQHALAQHGDFYLAYVGDRITGFMGHWMTFGAAQMVALTLLMAAFLFAPPRRRRWLLVTGAAIISASIVIGWTRSVWFAAAVSAAYIVAVWRPKFLLLAPVLCLVGWFIAPRSVKERVTSIYQPHGQVDSNQHRYVTRRVGWEMIKAHPWFGLGPEMPGKQFEAYLPADIPKPLPVGYYGHLHNIYLQYAAERGIPALLIFLWMIGWILRDWFQAARESRNVDAKAVLHGCTAAVIALLIEGFFEHNLGDSEVLSMFWTVVACGYRATEVNT